MKKQYVQEWGSSLTRRLFAINAGTQLQIEKLRATHALQKKEAMAELKTFKRMAKEKEETIRVGERCFHLTCVCYHGDNHRVSHYLSSDGIIL